MISETEIREIISYRGLREKSEYRVTYLVQLALYYIRRCIEQKIEIPDLKNEYLCAKYDLVGWSNYITSLNKKEREKIYDLIKYREVELRVPKKKLERYPIYILYDTYRMETEIANGFDVVEFNLTSILLEPPIASILNLDLEKKYKLKEIKIAIGRDIIQRVLQRIEGKYITFFAVLSSIETRIEEEISFTPEETIGGDLAPVISPEEL